MIFPASVFDRVDRYIARIFWSSYLVTFVFFFGLFYVFDLFGNADDFFKIADRQGVAGHRMLGWVVAYYAYYTPAVFLQISPFVTVIGVMVALARLGRANELVPILMSGRSVFRMLRPIFVWACVLTVGMIVVQEIIAPYVASRRIELREFLTEGVRVFELEQPVPDQQGNTWVNVRFNLASQELESGWVLRQEGELAEYGHVEGGFYDHDHRAWRFPEGVTMDISDGTASTQKTVKVIESSMDPKTIEANKMEAFDLSLKQLGLLVVQTGKPRFQVLLHYHITFPLTNVLLILLAVPFVIRYEKRRVLLGLATAFMLCSAYFGVDFAFRALGEGPLHPVLAAWFTPIFFGALGISLFDGIRT